MIRSCNYSGFTLIEVALSVAILGIGLVTLIGLQTRHMANYARERDLSRAAMLAQYILSATEADADFPEEGVRAGSLAGELKRLGYFSSDEETASTEPLLRDWVLNESVSNLSIGQLDKALQRIDLTITWGDGPSQQYHVVYFMKGPGPEG